MIRIYEKDRSQHVAKVYNEKNHHNIWWWWHASCGQKGPFFGFKEARDNCNSVLEKDGWIPLGEWGDSPTVYDDEQQILEKSQ